MLINTSTEGVKTILGYSTMKERKILLLTLILKCIPFRTIGMLVNTKYLKAFLSNVLKMLNAIF